MRRHWSPLADHGVFIVMVGLEGVNRAGLEGTLRFHSLLLLHKTYGVRVSRPGDSFLIPQRLGIKTMLSFLRVCGFFSLQSSFKVQSSSYSVHLLDR